MITHIPDIALRLAAIPDAHCDFHNPPAMAHARECAREMDEFETLGRIYLQLVVLALQWPRMTG